MGLFDDPEMQLMGFEQQRLNNAQRNSPYLNFKTGVLTDPTMQVQLDLLSGAPPSSIQWDKGGIAHQDPTMFKLTKSDYDYWSRLTPDQDPQFKKLALDKTAKIYSDMTPEQIRALHYTDEASFHPTVQRDLSIMKTSSDYANAFSERQKAIQDLRIGSRSVNNLASELERYGFDQAAIEIARHGDRANLSYSKNLRRYLQDNPEDFATENFFTKKYGFDIENPQSRIKVHKGNVSISPFYIPHRKDFERQMIAPFPEESLPKRRQDTLALLSEWEQMTRKRGVGTEQFTEQIANNRGAQRFSTGGFLLGLAGIAGEMGMISRVLKGGEFIADGNNVDVALPSELVEDGGKKYIKADYDAYHNQMAAFHPDNAANHPEITDEMRREFYKAKGLNFDQ